MLLALTPSDKSILQDNKKEKIKKLEDIYMPPSKAHFV